MERCGPSDPAELAGVAAVDLQQRDGKRNYNKQYILPIGLSSKHCTLSKFDDFLLKSGGTGSLN
jgi:hypothetical protein